MACNFSNFDYILNCNRISGYTVTVDCCRNKNIHIGTKILNSKLWHRVLIHLSTVVYQCRTCVFEKNMHLIEFSFKKIEIYLSGTIMRRETYCCWQHICFEHSLKLFHVVTCLPKYTKMNIYSIVNYTCPHMHINNLLKCLCA